MDGQRFDASTKSLARGLTRRTLEGIPRRGGGGRTHLGGAAQQRGGEYRGVLRKAVLAQYPRHAASISFCHAEPVFNNCPA
jgi:hypothetical protein